MALPDLNPLVAANAFCSTCGIKMKITVEKDKAGRAHKIVYTCTNAETGCSYAVESDERMSGMARPVKIESK